MQTSFSVRLHAAIRTMRRIFKHQRVIAGISRILLIVLLGTLFAPLSVCEQTDAQDREFRFVAIDVCHAGDAGVSVNAESPLFAEFRSEHFLFKAPVSMVFLISLPYALLIFASKYRPPEC